LTLLLAQSPDAQALVLVTRRANVSVATANTLAKELRQSLADAGVTSPVPPEQLQRKLQALGVKDAKSCDGKRPCALELGRQLGVATVVSFSLAQISKDVSIYAEALRVSDGTKLAEETWVITADDASTAAALFAAFSLRVHDALAPKEQTPAKPPEQAVAPPPPPPPPAPTVTAPPPDVTAPPPANRSRVPAFVAGGATLLAGAAAIAFAVSGFADKSQLDARTVIGGVMFPTVTYSDAQALAASANTKATIALVCAITAAVLASLTAVLFGTSG
jgi:hypothetical protein